MAFGHLTKLRGVCGVSAAKVEGMPWDACCKPPEQASTDRLPLTFEKWCPEVEKTGAQGSQIPPDRKS